MSKKSKISDYFTEVSEYSDARLVYPVYQTKLEGRLLTFIETLGFENQREKAVKDVVRDALHEFFNSALYVSPSLAKEVREKYEKEVERLAMEHAQLS